MGVFNFYSMFFIITVFVIIVESKGKKRGPIIIKSSGDENPRESDLILAGFADCEVKKDNKKLSQIMNLSQYTRKLPKYIPVKISSVRAVHKKVVDPFTRYAPQNIPMFVEKSKPEANDEYNMGENPTDDSSNDEQSDTENYTNEQSTDRQPSGQKYMNDPLSGEFSVDQYDVDHNSMDKNTINSLIRNYIRNQESESDSKVRKISATSSPIAYERSVYPIYVISRSNIHKAKHSRRSGSHNLRLRPHTLS